MSGSELREIGREEWVRWSETATELPITCDPGWAQAVEAAYRDDPHPFRVRPWLLRHGQGEALLVGYETGWRACPTVTLSPFGLYCGVALRGLGREQALELFEAKLRLRTRSISYTLPFYAGRAGPADAADQRETTTHVLDLDAPYETLFATRFKGAVRTCIRRAEQEDVRVSVTRDPACAHAYYEMHRRLASQKGGYGDLLPEGMFVELIARSQRCELAVAYVGNSMASGGVFLDDGLSTFYWHAATDRAFIAHQPNYALLSVMIRRSIERGKTYFNLGGSAGIASLEKFKESWGATERTCYSRSSSNPLIRQIKRVIGR